MDASANLIAENDQKELRWYQMYQLSDYHTPGLKYNNPEHRAIMREIYESKVRPSLEREHATSSSNSSNVHRTPTQSRTATSDTSPRATFLYHPSVELMPAQPNNNVMVNITQQQYQLKIVTTETVKGFKEFIIRFKASYTAESRMQCITQEVKKAINSLFQVSIQMRKIPEEWKNWQQLDHDTFFELLERLYPKSTRDAKSSMSAQQQLLKHEYKVPEFNQTGMAKWIMTWRSLELDYRTERINEGEAEMENGLQAIAKKHMEDIKKKGLIKILTEKEELSPASDDKRR